MTLANLTDRSAKYRRLWRVVEGAVRDALNTHPEYLTPLGRRKAQDAITKRVTGQVMSYVERSTQGRAGQPDAPDTESGAVWTPPSGHPTGLSDVGPAATPSAGPSFDSSGEDARG